MHKYSQPLLSTLLWHLWQQLQPQVFWNMKPQAWHTYLWPVSPIPLYRTSRAPSGWMGSVGAQQFPDPSRDVQWDSSLGSGWTFTELSWNHSINILAVCLGSLSCWKMNRRPSLRSRVLWSWFSSRVSLSVAAFIFPSVLTSVPVPVA